ncbi:hypothetical protein SJ05684_b60270 (plasmid) [Sinorhizobium sojae CCBAU 05684]|uniref:Uncharacterized protein n=1 Tax=Sinorhizobium sojae CCBAU 05684 TaxID=716928 RepID=A0A249PNY2_9HYPH|nr:hypothetical protein SJ05684_b60270 [Sinorhizobium sojae CCBAU 05684]
MADKGRDIGADIGGCGLEEGRRPECQHQLMQARADAEEVGRADDHLTGRKRQGRHLERPSENPHRASERACQDDIAERSGDAGNAEQKGAGPRQSDDPRRAFGHDEAGKARHGGKTKPDGDAAEENDFRHFLAAETPARIEAVADGSAAQGRHAHIVADREAGERGDGHPAVGEPLPDIAHRQRVEQREAEIGEADETNAGEETAQRDLQDRVQDFAECVSAERPVDQPGGDSDGGEYE